MLIASPLEDESSPSPFASVFIKLRVPATVTVGVAELSAITSFPARSSTMFLFAGTVTFSVVSEIITTVVCVFAVAAVMASARVS